MKRSILLLALCAMIFAFAPAALASDPCVVPDDGSGTVTMPPEGCGYISPDRFHAIVNGLPPGTTIIVKPEHGWFVCNGGRGGRQERGCTIGGTPETGETEEFESTVRLTLSGAGGPLDGYTRTLDVPATVRTKVGPRKPGQPVQSFQTEMLSIEGEVVGDHDFAYLKISGGSESGIPSPGETTLSYAGNGKWHVDSKFEVGYNITFEGAAGSLLEGSGGTTTGSVSMSAVAGPDADNADVHPQR
ncbi:MAG: hypothetical protein AAF604_20410 [Acidobacteriota bacterium]